MSNDKRPKFKPTLDVYPVTHVAVVSPAECDQLGHMNVAEYVRHFDDGAWSLFAHMGVDLDFLTRRRLSFAAVDMHVQYLREVLAGDMIVVTSQLLEIGGKRSVFRQVMSNCRAGVVSAVMTNTGICMDLNTRRAVDIPADMLARGQALVARGLEHPAG